MLAVNRVVEQGLRRAPNARLLLLLTPRTHAPAQAAISPTPTPLTAKSAILLARPVQLLLPMTANLAMLKQHWLALPRAPANA